MSNTNGFQDLALLSLLVSEAFAGVDITRQYPALYQILLADPNMQKAFLDALETLEQERNGTLEPLPCFSELLGTGQPPVITPDDIKILLDYARKEVVTSDKSSVLTRRLPAQTTNRRGA